MSCLCLLELQNRITNWLRQVGNSREICSILPVTAETARDSCQRSHLSQFQVPPRTDIPQSLWVTSGVWPSWLCKHFSQYPKYFLLLQLLTAIATHPFFSGEPGSIFFTDKTTMRSSPLLSWLLSRLTKHRSQAPAPWPPWCPSATLSSVCHCPCQSGEAKFRHGMWDVVSKAPEGKNHFPRAAGYMPANAAQHGLGLLPWKSTLLTHVHLLHQHHQVHTV